MKRLDLLQTKWFYSLQEKLRYRSVLLDLFSITELPECKNKAGDKVRTSLKLAKSLEFNLDQWSLISDSEPIVVCQWQGEIAGVEVLPNNKIKLTYLGDYNLEEPVLSPYDEIELMNVWVPNYKDKPNTQEFTTIGRYLANYFLYIHPFGDKIPYVNDLIDLGDTEKAVATLYIDKKVDLSVYDDKESSPHDHFMNNFFFLCGFGDLFVPVFSRKSLQTSPLVAQRKKELLEQYKDQLNDPVIAAMIEDELIKLDKEWLKDDPSYGFYASESKKFNVHRKKQFLVGGVAESFGAATTQHTFIKNSLSEGWSKDEFPSICNEIRKGSYDRGIETALGGEQSKYLLRIFQNTKITEQDCGTTKGLQFKLIQSLAKKFLGRYVTMNGKLTLLDENNIQDFIDREVVIRSLMFCKSKPGICYKCAGRIFEQLGSKAIGVFSIDIGTTFLKTSMKAMHGTKMSSFKVSSLSNYLVDVV